MGACATKLREPKDDDGAAAPLPEPTSPKKEATAGAGDVKEVIEAGGESKAEIDVDEQGDKSRSLSNLFKEKEGKEEILNAEIENEENLNDEQVKKVVVVEESEIPLEKKKNKDEETINEEIKFQKS
ncbi:uncharacterized protein LOC124929253 [Impatiens glandulifera]|uniref:uncharacterized protein LOC124929253 n=1 Tax=Impatiens glandulifera TaxID=253017 RepID=UPI001FB10C22|nr:uncharacterized protein LOC124929253 [Impatiens glandulifera]